MANELKMKHSAEYYFIKAVNLQRELEDAKSDVAWRTRALDEANNKPKKKVSPFFVVFSRGKNGSYVDPVIVEADCPEEALCPEGSEVPRGEFCQRLWAEEEYDDI